MGPAFEVTVIPRAGSGSSREQRAPASATGAGGRCVISWAREQQQAKWTRRLDRGLLLLASRAYAALETSRVQERTKQGQFEADEAVRRQPGNAFRADRDEPSGIGRSGFLSRRGGAASRDELECGSEGVLGPAWRDSIFSVMPVHLHTDGAAAGGSSSAGSEAGSVGAGAAAAASAAGAGTDDAGVPGSSSALPSLGLAGGVEAADETALGELAGVDLRELHARWVLLRAWGARFVGVAGLVDVSAGEGSSSLAALMVEAAQDRLPTEAKSALWEGAVLASTQRRSAGEAAPADSFILTRARKPAVTVNRHTALSTISAQRFRDAALTIPGALERCVKTDLPALLVAASASAKLAGCRQEPSSLQAVFRAMCFSHSVLRYSVVAQTAEQLSTKRPVELRNAERAFCAQLAGEHADDFGGPYRAMLAVLEEEVQPEAAEVARDRAAESAKQFAPVMLASEATERLSTLRKTVGAVPLFRLAPNARTGAAVGEETGLRDEVVPLPGRTMLEAAGSVVAAAALTPLYETVGVMMGVALRTGTPLGLRLAPIIWQRLLDALTSRGRWSAGDGLLNGRAAGRRTAHTHSLVTRADVRAFETRASTTLPGEEAEAAEAAAASWDGAVGAMACGILTQVPGPMLSLFSWRELEAGVAGEATVDVAALRSSTLYEGVASRLGSTHPSTGYAHQAKSTVEMFWTVLEQFSQHERSQYLRYVWGRSRLPSTNAVLGTGGETPGGAVAGTADAGARSGDDDGMLGIITGGLRLRHLLAVMPIPPTIMAEYRRAMLPALRRSGRSRSSDADVSPTAYAAAEAFMKPSDEAAVAKVASKMPLPTASTCFGRLKLPSYPSFSIMAAKLRFVLSHCDDIDADSNSAALHVARL